MELQAYVHLGEPEEGVYVDVAVKHVHDGSRKTDLRRSLNVSSEHKHTRLHNFSTTHFLQVLPSAKQWEVHLQSTLLYTWSTCYTCTPFDSHSLFPDDVTYKHTRWVKITWYTIIHTVKSYIDRILTGAINTTVKFYFAIIYGHFLLNTFFW